VVDHAVVGAAQQHEIVEVGGAAVDPVLDVVRCAVLGWGGAAGVGASVVAFGEGGALVAGGVAVTVPDIQRFTLAPEDQGG
jgi:hypothetical protein